MGSKYTTSPGGQIDASMKSMFFSDFGPVLGGFALVLTDIRTDVRTDKPSYRDARTHLKTVAILLTSERNPM